MTVNMNSKVYITVIVLRNSSVFFNGKLWELKHLCFQWAFLCNKSKYQNIRAVVFRCFNRFSNSLI